MSAEAALDNFDWKRRYVGCDDYLRLLQRRSSCRCIDDRVSRVSAIIIYESDASRSFQPLGLPVDFTYYMRQREG